MNLPGAVTVTWRNCPLCRPADSRIAEVVEELPRDDHREVALRIAGQFGAQVVTGAQVADRSHRLPLESLVGQSDQPLVERSPAA